MRLRIFTLLLAAAAAIGTANASTLALFNQLPCPGPPGPCANDWLFTHTNTSYTISAVNSNIIFINYSMPTLGVITSATLNWSMTSTTAAVASGTSFTEAGFSGWFTIKNGTSNILSGTLSGRGQLSATQGGLSAAFQDSTPPITEVVFTSDYMTFTGLDSAAIGLSWSGLNPPIGLSTGGFPGSVTGAGNGSFSVGELSTYAPEPATMGLFGFALIGLGMFHRKRSAR